MPEDNQIQTGFQSENQVNPQTQQNNFIQEQQVQGNSQQVNQQSNIETTQQKLPQNSKPHSSWVNKILGWLFILLGTALTGLGIYGIFSAGYDSIGVTLSFLLAGLGLLIIGIRNISGTNFLFWIKNLFFSQKTHSSWLVKIVSCIFLLFGIVLIGLGVYEIFQISSDWYYSTHYSTRDIIVNSGILYLGPFGIWFIILGILSYLTPNVDVYYHPTRLTKILSGIYRFLGIALVRSGLWNFSLIGTENLSFLKILYVGGVITLCGILYIFLGKLLYSIKNKMHLGFSMLCAIIINVMFARISRAFTDNSYGIDEDIFESFGVILVLFTLIYFSILTIRWIIKCRKFNKKGIINTKYLDSKSSKKKVGIITTIVLFSLVIIDLIYGKIQWSKIPEIDESIFAREEHQVKLPDEEDALIQLKNNYSSGYTNDVWEALEILYFSENDLDFQIQNSLNRYQNRCIIVYSGNETSCGTWTRDKKTLNKFFNSFYTNYPYSSFGNKEKDYDYFVIDGKKVTILEYLNKNEPKIRADLQKLDKIASLEYNLNFPSSRDDPYYLLPQCLQGYTRASMVLLQYYTLKKDWEMVEFIVKLIYKMVDILNNYGSTVPHLISFFLQNTTDSEVNSLIKLFPENFRITLSERYSNLNYDKERMIRERIKGEYDIIWRSWAKDGIFNDIGSNEPSLMQFMFHFPFLSKIDINRFMDYTYYNLIYAKNLVYDNNDFIQPNLQKHTLYNYYGTYPYRAILPRISTYENKLSYTLFHKKALINNLKSGNYQTWFNELEWSENPNLYNDNRLPTDDE